MTSWRDTVLSFSALPEVGALLLAADPAWIFARDGSRILWANPAGAARFGSARFAELRQKKWAPAHPLRRQIDSLVRSMPEKGTLARLHLVDAARAMPLACSCRRIRAEDEKGVLVTALDAAGDPPSLAELAAFFSDGDTTAFVADEAGALVAAVTEVEPAIDPDARFASIEEAGRKLRLYIAGEPLPESEAPPIPDALPPVEMSDVAGRAPAPQLRAEARWDERDPLREVDLPAAPVRQALAAEAVIPQALAVEPPPDPEPETREPEPAPAAPKPVIALEPAKQQPSPAKTGAFPPIGRDSLAQPEPNPVRSVMAGRVARELSRKPVRFLWQTDAADRFLFVSPGLAQVVGRNAEIVGERWQDAADRLRLDPAGRIARALGQRDTWSGQTAWWPIEGSNVRVPAELTALPVFGGDHSFQGYRGFGVLRPAEALMPAAFEARFGTAEQPIPKPAVQLPPYEEAVATTPANVVPIRADLERTADHIRLTPQERSAFEEIAAALRQRVVNEPEPPPAEATPPQAEAPPEPPHDSPPPRGEVPGLDPGIREGQPLAAPSPERTPTPSLAHKGGGGALTDAERGAPPSLAPAPPEHDFPSGEGPPPTPDSDAPAIPALPRKGAPEHLADGDVHRRLREMTAILDTATDGVLILHGDGGIESANASAEALFGLEAHELQAMNLGDLLVEQSRELALDYLSGLRENGVASLLNEGREVEAKAGAGSIPLFMTMGRISGEGGGRFCAVLRDITHWKRTEGELVAAKRAAEAASSQKSEFLARVSHEIRTPLNAIIGFAEVMIEERFGPIEHDRYREYLRDIRTSGEHVVSLVNDLLDISKIEAGKLDLTFVAVPLNELVRECIALMQPQANRAHVVLRSSLSRDVPAIVADQRTLRQIVLNLLSNSVKFTGPGGQVIASTSLAETGEALLRVRDTGEGMSEDELARALEPFRQIATSTLSDRTGTGLGLPLTKALVEANRASLAIRSARGEGTIVTITFPPTRVLSE